jgi:hypothetical protein
MKFYVRKAAGWRRVIISEEELARDNVQLPPMPPLRLIVFFKEKTITEAATRWINTYSHQNNVEMQITHSASTGFHVLELLGPATTTQPLID